MDKIIKGWITAILLSFLCVGSAYADIIEVGIDAVVISVDDQDGTFADVVPGTPVQAIYRYDTNASDIDPAADSARYLVSPDTGLMTINMGPYTITSEPDPETGSSHEIYINDGSLYGQEHYSVSTSSFAAFPGVAFMSGDFKVFRLATTTPFPLELSTQVPNAAAYDGREFQLSGMGVNGVPFWISGEVTGFTVLNIIPTVSAPLPPPPGPTHVFTGTARITDVFNETGYAIMPDYASVGDVMTLEFGYSTKTPVSKLNTGIYDENAEYFHAAGEGAVSLLINGTHIDSLAIPGAIRTQVRNELDSNLMDNFSLFSEELNANTSQPMAPQSVAISFDVTGWLSSVDMPTKLPPLPSVDSNQILIYGNGWLIRANIETLEGGSGEFVPNDVFPGSGVLHPMQTPGVSIWHNSPLNVTEMGVEVNGINHTTEINCQPQPRVMANRQAITCTGLSGILSPGVNDVQFWITLEDGSLINRSVVWNVKE